MTSSPPDDPLAHRLQRLRDDLTRLRTGIDAGAEPVAADVEAVRVLERPAGDGAIYDDEGWLEPEHGELFPDPAPPPFLEDPAVPTDDDARADAEVVDTVHEPGLHEAPGLPGGPTSDLPDLDDALPEVDADLAPSPLARERQTASPQRASPQRASPQRASPQAASPQAASPQRASPQAASPQTAPPRTAPPRRPASTTPAQVEPSPLPPVRAPRRRARPPRPPRRPLSTPRARRPPERFRVPQPVPVRPPLVRLRSRWPSWTPVAVVVVAVAAIPLVAQLAWRIWHATASTSSLLGADPAPDAFLRAADGVAGGALTLALGFCALAVARGRSGYLGFAVAVLLGFGAFPWVAYTARGGVASRPTPTLGDLIAPPGWPRTAQLRAAFVLALALLLAALVDLLWLQARRERR